MTTPATRQLQVDSLSRIAEDVVLIDLIDPGGTPLPAWGAGDHIALHLPADRLRQYSLCGDRTQPGWRIAVRREADGRGASQFLYDELRKGDLLTATGPHSAFPLLEGPRYLFIAGGIGITPLLPMMTEVERRGAQWAGVCLSTQRSRMPFATDLEEQDWPVSLHYSQAGNRWDVTSAIADLDPGTLVYACGPERLLDAIRQACGRRDDIRLRSESFAPTDRSGLKATPFDVELGTSGQVLHVAADTTLLDVLIDAGIDVLSSCGEGTCGTCEVLVCSGEIDHRDDVLNDDDRKAADRMLVCVSRGRGRLVLDV